MAIELATGRLIVAPDYRFMPQSYLKIDGRPRGGPGQLLRMHIATGILWTIVFVVYATFGLRHYLQRRSAPQGSWHRQRRLSMAPHSLLLLLKRTNEDLPPQGAYNAGQKLYAMLVYSMVPIIMISGWIMAFHLVGTVAVQWAMLIHFLAAGMVVSGLMVHVYMGAVFPEEKPAFYSMITGTVDELYAYRHHFKWWREVKLQQVEAEKRQLSEPDKGTNQAPESFSEEAEN